MTRTLPRMNAAIEEYPERRQRDPRWQHRQEGRVDTPEREQVERGHVAALTERSRDCCQPSVTIDERPCAQGDRCSAASTDLYRRPNECGRRDASLFGVRVCRKRSVGVLSFLEVTKCG